MRITAILLPCRIIIAPGIQVVYFLPAATSGNDLLTRRLDSLRQGCGWYGNIILSSSTLGSVAEHLHCVIELPRGDANFPTKCLVPQYAEMEYCQLRREELWDNYCMGVQ